MEPQKVINILPKLGIKNQHCCYLPELLVFRKITSYLPELAKNVPLVKKVQIMFCFYFKIILAVGQYDFKVKTKHNLNFFYQWHIFHLTFQLSIGSSHANVGILETTLMELLIRFPTSSGLNSCTFGAALRCTFRGLRQFLNMLNFFFSSSGK